MTELKTALEVLNDAKQNNKKRKEAFKQKQMQKNIQFFEKCKKNIIEAAAKGKYSVICHIYHNDNIELSEEQKRYIETKGYSIRAGYIHGRYCFLSNFPFDIPHYIIFCHSCCHPCYKISWNTEKKK